jgi:putative ABC transport system ATP-binding protein
MRPHCALYIDAGYLFAAAATRVTGTSLRAGIAVDYERLIAALAAHAESQSGFPLLRAHWYDSSHDGDTDAIQRAIGELPRVKMRLGREGHDSGQKGVDLRIGLDLMSHASNGVVEAMYLVSGEDDLTEAVEEAQARGAQVTVLALPNAEGNPHAISEYLRLAADSFDLFDAQAVDACFSTKVSSPQVLEMATATARPASDVPSRPKRRRTFAHASSPRTGARERGDTAIDTDRLDDRIDDRIDKVSQEVFESWTADATAQDWRALFRGKPSLPDDVDRALFEDLTEAVGANRVGAEIRHRLRDRFWAYVESQSSDSTDTAATESARPRFDRPVVRQVSRQPLPTGARDGTNGVAARAVDLVRVYGAGDTLVRALDGVSVEFGKGEFTAIMGPSGSGKSTLMHCLAGLDSTTSGDVSIGETKLTGLSDNQMTTLRRDRIGFVFQAFNLIPTLTALENITLPIDIAGKTADGSWLDTIVSRLGLKDRLHHRPSELSGGQQQRVACARALVAKPDIIFGDEPTGNLDSRSSGEVLSILRAAVDEFGQTVVIVTHDPSAASYADRVVFLADGAVVDELFGPTADSVLDRMKSLEAVR